jgi:carbon-monoxide dehydrogenase medium subunit
VALAGVGPTALLVPGLDELLAGTTPGEAGFRAAAEAAEAVVRPTDDQRGSAAYKRAMAGVFTRRVLESCCTPHAR